MFIFKEIFLTTFMTLIVFASCKSQAVEETDIESNVVNTNPAEIAVLTQLNVTISDLSDGIYTYQCTVGTYSSNRLACAARDSTSWPSPQNVQLNLRCPKSGSGLTLSYVEIIFSVSSPSVNCIVSEGGIGWGYIRFTVNAWSTTLLSYSANFFTY